MRLNQRGDSDAVMWGFLIVLGAICLLAYIGARQLWAERKAPDDKCYWLAVDVGGRPACLLDTPPEGECVKMVFLYAHQVMCADRDRLADFTQKTGRRLCGQVSTVCQSVVQ